MTSQDTSYTSVAVNRVIFPITDQHETAPLYAIPWQPRVSSQSFAQGTKRGPAENSPLRATTPPFVEPSDVYEFIDRRSIRVLPHRRLSLGTYFNAFPASYWQRWTGYNSVTLTVTIKGSGQLLVIRSSARGRYGVSNSLSVADETVSVELPLKSFFDGGYYWFDVIANDGGAEISDAEWSVKVLKTFTPHTVSVAVTTFNRPSYCVNQIKTIAHSADTRAVLDKLYVIDQGTDHVEAQQAFPAAAAELGDQLALIYQPNLGGSGGFSRGMYETVKASTSDYVLLLDDDAICEPESIVRAVNFAQFCLKPTLVGGGMLHLDDRPVLYTQGERYDPRTAWMSPAGPDGYDHDFAAKPLRDSPLLHRRNDVDFNGWWMTLIPTQVIREIGLSLPAFIKWDDLEYAIRAQEHGYQTVSLPGVAVWHMAWHDKDPVRTWEEYFTHRNRVIGTLMHSRVPRGGKLPLRSLLGDLKLLLSLEYSAVHLRRLALRDAFTGPDVLSKTIKTRLQEIREERTKFSDAQVISDVRKIPTVRPIVPARADGGHLIPRAALAVRTGLRHVLRKTSTERLSAPEKSIQSQDILWWRFAEVDSALVTTPSGDGVAWFKRDRDTLRELLKSSIGLNLKLRREWDRLAEQYARDLPRVTSLETWERIFEIAEQPNSPVHTADLKAKKPTR
ncbi:glycosyltransferase [Pseudoclavibacter sp. CFCC 13611]|uniref:glycosyltransferase n=1 Tax=Pseudoclavibacter sp. CFCC 13611 TaxID=2615178 RepID=UPI0013014759|nr:glycosyltransferase [Pseudoclavibacter sp. CFCC 13611]KAB1663002.1 glycosyltransferase family 2 protein [Pseudoclavibacter sp. CFCC 13611]